MKRIIEIQIPGLPKITSNGSQGSWRAKWANAKKWQAMVMNHVFFLWNDSPLKKAKLTLVRASSNEPDFDNLATSFKPVIDGLVKAGVIENDKSTNIKAIYKWEKCSPRNGHIKIKVEGVVK